MASETVNGQADLLLAKLGEKAKAYRLANINKRLTESSVGVGSAGLGAGGSADRIQQKKDKVEANHASVTWQFTKEDGANGDLIIKAIAPADRGGYTKVWGYVDGETGKVRPDLNAAYVDANSISDTYRAAFFDKITHLGTHW
jgi:hypothetical protein